MRGVLAEILNDIRKHKKYDIHFDRAGYVSEESEDDEGYILFRDGDEEPTAEEGFDTESQLLIQEIELRIEKLRQKGIESYLIEKLFCKRETMLSRMHITRDFHIYLNDYFDMEIFMTPLPKAVYILFLRHPEGITFKSLTDYRQELTDIYNRIKPAFGSTASLRSIEAVTDPLSNSINENCSRIREAFVSKFDEHLAQNYIITGRRGEPKKILLPRTLVKWDDEIADLFE